jgi:outer membrane protein TolC
MIRCEPALVILLVTAAGDVSEVGAQPRAPAPTVKPREPSQPPARPRRRLSLDELTRMARSGPRADAARFATRQAEAQVIEAGGARFPRFELRALAAPSPDIDCIDPNCTMTSTNDATLDLAGAYGSVEITLAQPLFTFGKLSAARDGARSAAAAARRQEGSVAGDLEVDAARAYYGLKLAREMRFELEGGVADIEKARKQLAEQIDAGGESATIQDRLRLDTVLAEAKARLAEAREGEETALAAVRVLARDQKVDIDDAALAPVENQLGDAAHYTAQAETTRPELAALRHAVSATRSLAALERARFFPDLLLVGSFNFARAQGVDDPPSAFARDPFNTTSVGLAAALRWTFEPFSQRGRLLRARARSDEAGAQLRAAGEGVRLDVERAHAQARNAHVRLTATAEGEKSARGWVASIVQAEAIGVVEAKELADAYVAYFSLRARYLQAVHDWNVAVIRLRRATGPAASRPRSTSGQGSSR